MAPKPALFDSGKGGGVDTEHSLIEASQEAANYTKEYPSEYDEASLASDAEHSFVSNSDVSTTDGEYESQDSAARKERRSRRRRSSRRKKSRSKDRRSSRSQSVERSYEKDEENEEAQPEEDTEAEESVQDHGLDDSSVPSQRRSSVLQDQQEPPTFVLPTGKAADQPVVKLLNFQTLHRAEQDRRPQFSGELQQVVEQWTQCKITLHRLLEEVEHANHLFQVSEASFHQYSHVMFTIHKDIFLDDQGNRVTSSARQQLLLKQRGTDPVSGREELLGGEGYLDPLYNSFSVLTDTMMKTVLERESDNGKQAAAIEFQEFSEELITQAEAMKALGDSVVKEMEGSEMDIQNSFRVMEQLAAKVKSAKSSNANVLDDDIKLKKPDKNFPKDMGYGGNNANVGDWWLWETLYRAAVKHQQVTWSANYDRVQGLQESLQFFQDKHEKKLEKAVLAVMPEQREMFLVGAKAFESALKKTDAFADEVNGAAAMDPEDIADEFEKGVQKRSSSLIQDKTHHKSTILNRSRSKYNPAIQQAETLSATSSGELNSKPLPAFGSPMQSKLVLRAQVLERWEKPGWMTTIAVFTVDRFLHLFDCTDLDTKTLPQTAFASMFPTTASTRTNVHYQGGGRKRASRATEHKIPTPSMTFNLVTCTLKTYGYARRSFEIKQVADPTAKSRDLPHTTLRFKDNPEAAEWYGLLQDLPSVAPEPTYNPEAEQRHQQVDLDLAEVEAEAARATALYDETDELAGSDHEGERLSEAEGSKHDLHDISEGDEEENEKEEDGAMAEADMFEDASEYLEDPHSVEGVVSDGFKKEAVEVETVDEKSDDSFHSWN